MDLKRKPFCTARQAYVSFTYHSVGIHVSTGVVLIAVTMYVRNINYCKYHVYATEGRYSRMVIYTNYLSTYVRMWSNVHSIGFS